MCDPFMTERRRFKTEFNRYLSQVNLDFLPPMPKPIPRSNNSSKKTLESNNFIASSNYSNMKISNKSFNNNYTESNDLQINNNNNNNNNNDINKKINFNNQRQLIDNYTNQNMMTRSTEFY
jgi:hypothetical protein